MSIGYIICTMPKAPIFSLSTLPDILTFKVIYAKVTNVP